MIPKKIHYCWFGIKPLPDSALKCIESWKKYCPDYQIIEWNETNFDINSHQFVKECYETKKFGFIVDVLRMYVLKKEGGIYLDVDVELIKPIDQKLLENYAFAGFEQKEWVGVGIVGSVKEGEFVNEVYNDYADRHIVNKDGSLNTNFTGPMGVSKILGKHGFLMNGEYQSIKNYFTIYPIEYFAPKNYQTGLTEITNKTIVVHHYDASWMDSEVILNNQKKNRRIEYLNMLKGEFPSRNEFVYFLMIYAKISFINIFTFYSKYVSNFIRDKLKIKF